MPIWGFVGGSYIVGSDASMIEEPSRDLPVANSIYVYLNAYLSVKTHYTSGFVATYDLHGGSIRLNIKERTYV